MYMCISVYFFAEFNLTMSNLGFLHICLEVRLAYNFLMFFLSSRCQNYRSLKEKLGTFPLDPLKQFLWHRSDLRA